MNNQEEVVPQSTLMQTKIRILHGVILSNQKIINQQQHLTHQLKQQINQWKQKVKLLQSNQQSKFTINQQTINNKQQTLINNLIQIKPLINTPLQMKVKQLQQLLIETKLQLAQKCSDSLEQQITLFTLKKQHHKLQEQHHKLQGQLQMISNKSQVQNIIDYSNDQSITQNDYPNDQSITQNSNSILLNQQIPSQNNNKTVTKQNISQYMLNSSPANYNQYHSSYNNPNTYNNSQALIKINKLWLKYIQKQQKHQYKHNHTLNNLNKNNTINNFHHRNNLIYHNLIALNKNKEFSTLTYPLLLKSYLPIQLRPIIWQLLITDKLSITQTLYQKLKQKSQQQNGVQKLIKWQIHKDMVRSFNGQSSKINLLKVYNKTHSKSLTISINKHQINQIKQQQKSLSNTTLYNTNTILHNTNTALHNRNTLIINTQFLKKQTVQTNDTMSVYNTFYNAEEGVNIRETTQIINRDQQLQPQEAIYQRTSTIQAHSQQQQQIFPIQQSTTRILQIFSLYRPDIGFVQGMTYPTIILSLILSQNNTFKLLSNILLTKQFFYKMITVQQGFVDIICRVFDQMLLERNEKLYNRLNVQLNVRSQVFVVDWFWTFYSRNLSPISILKIWDLIIYNLALQSEHLQIILYELALSILQMLQPIIYHTNYQQTIRAVREYWRKIDEGEMINLVYSRVTKWSSLQDSYKKVLKKVIKRVIRK